MGDSNYVRHVRGSAESMNLSPNSVAPCVALRRRSNVVAMTATPLGDVESLKADASVRLRVDVYDALAKERGVPKPPQQARLHGISRSQMYRLRNGDRRTSLALAMRMARDLGTKVEVLFEEVAA